jgi:hypothetical protein
MERVTPLGQVAGVLVGQVTPLGQIVGAVFFLEWGGVAEKGAIATAVCCCRIGQGTLVGNTTVI